MPRFKHFTAFSSAADEVANALRLREERHARAQPASGVAGPFSDGDRTLDGAMEEATRDDIPIEAAPGLESMSVVSRLSSATKLRGTTVRGPDNKKLGAIDTIILDWSTGRIVYLIITVGGFLGLGQRYCPIPWRAFRYDGNRQDYSVAMDTSVLNGAPSFRRDTWPTFDDAYAGRVTEYFRRLF